MNLEEIKSLIINNEDDIKNIEKVLARSEVIEAYKGASKATLEDRKRFLVDQNTKLTNFITNAEKIVEKIENFGMQLNNEKDSKKRKEIREKIEKEKETLNREKRNVLLESQGKTKEVISNIFGQFDKRIHNIFYGSDTKANFFQNLAWKLHSKYVNWRYEHPYIYVPLGIIASVGVFIGASAAFVANWPIFVISGAFSVNFLAKAGSMIFNLSRYGDMPELIRNKTIRKGSIVENIKNAIFERKNTKNANKNVSFIKKKDGRTDNGPKPISDAEKQFNRYRENLNNMKLEELLLDTLNDDKAKKLSDIVSALSSNKEKLSSEEQNKLGAIEKLVKDYLNKSKPEEESREESKIDITKLGEIFKKLPKEWQEYIINDINERAKYNPYSDDEIMGIVSKQFSRYLEEKKAKEKRIQECRKKLSELVNLYKKGNYNETNVDEYKRVLIELKDSIKQLNEYEQKQYEYLSNAIDVDYEKYGKALSDLINGIDSDNPSIESVAKVIAIANSFDFYTFEKILTKVPEKLKEKIDALLEDKIKISSNLNDLIEKLDIDDMMKLLIINDANELDNEGEDMLRFYLNIVEIIQVISNEYEKLNLPLKRPVPMTVLRENEQKYRQIVSLNKLQLNAAKAHLNKPSSGMHL